MIYKNYETNYTQPASYKRAT